MSQLVLDNEGKEVSKETIISSNSDYDGVVVLRSAGIEEAVLRLGMLVLRNMNRSIQHQGMSSQY